MEPCHHTPTPDQIDGVLRSVIDPELGLNIVDLGLIYGVIAKDGAVRVQMTLTTQGCPMHQSLVEGVRRALFSLESVSTAEVELVWDPPWHPSMMSPKTRERLGLAPA
jgi:metal-sulfur cluster biosynthetic enzyme